VPGISFELVAWGHARVTPSSNSSSDGQEVATTCLISIGRDNPRNFPRDFPVSSDAQDSSSRYSMCWTVCRYGHDSDSVACRCGVPASIYIRYQTASSVDGIRIGTTRLLYVSMCGVVARGCLKKNTSVPAYPSTLCALVPGFADDRVELWMGYRPE